ncbi:MAG: hypothetical protein P9L90_05290 [Candidatus Aadella gelida]|nr:hypothetical protein [Candidatus Aadella gelida]
MKKRSHHIKLLNSPERLKNIIRLKLLTILPSFQKDVKGIRAELNIQPVIFSNDKKFDEWHKKEITDKSDKIMGSLKFQKAAQKIESMKDYGESLKKKWELYDSLPSFRLRHREKILGKKYKLPGNFYRNSHNGLRAYIMRNRIEPPLNNWSIEFDPDSAKGPAKWFAIKVFAPLSKKEIEDATRSLASFQKRYFPKEIMVTTRERRKFKRDFEMFEELVLKRKNKPVKRKKYSDCGYLKYIIKDKNISPKELRRMKRMHKDEIKIVYDEVITKEIAKKWHIKPSTARQAIKRVNELITEFFGDEFTIKH